MQGLTCYGVVAVDTKPQGSALEAQPVDCSGAMGVQAPHALHLQQEASMAVITPCIGQSCET